MALSNKSYIINRETDWLNFGIVDNFYFENDNMCLQNKDGKCGNFISYSFDSGEIGTIWHRLRIKSKLPENAIMRVSLYASDSLSSDIHITADRDKTILIDDYLKDESIPLKERVRLLNKFSSTIHYDNCYDVPLLSLKGRYLWIAIEVLNYKDEDLYIESLRLDFPMDSLLEYLPEIYQRNSPPDSFFNRFLSMYQAVYDGISDEFDRLPEMLDPLRVDREFLDWLVGWFSIKNSYIWGEDKLRKLLLRIVDLYKIKGTKKAVSDIVEFYTDTKPIIVEQYSVIHNEFYERNKKCVQNLFGKNGYVFTVILDSYTIEDSDQYIALLKLINMFKPAETICNLVVLNNNIYLDYHCYLGVNSYLSQNNQMILNTESIIMDSTFLAD